MNGPIALPGLDWASLSLVLAMARAGSLTAASQTTGLSQPTLGRRLDVLERQLGATLFVRGRGGLFLTETGTTVITRAQAMEGVADELLRTLAGGAEQPAGDVRVTASRVVANYLLPTILAQLAETDPAIRLDVVATDEVANLLRRDADIAIRMVRPTQPDLIARRVGDPPLSAYASPRYVERHGLPEPTVGGC